MTDPREEISNMLKALWPHFLEWIEEYVGSPVEARDASYSREDMRYAYKAGFDKAIDYVEMVDHPMVGEEIAERLRNIK